jgi:hypothetical protein
MAGSLLFQRFIFENGTPEECERLDRMRVGFSAFMTARRADEIEKMLEKFEAEMCE